MQFNRVGWEREYRPVNLLSLVTITKEGVTIAETDLYIHRRKDSYAREVSAGEDITRRRESLEAACRRGILFTKVETDFSAYPLQAAQLEQPHPTPRQQMLQQLSAVLPTETDAEIAAAFLQAEERYLILGRSKKSTAQTQRR